MNRKLQISAALSALLLLAGCSANDAKDTNKGSEADGKIQVVATTTQICDYTKELAGELVKLECLLEPNASAHELETTASQKEALKNAEILLVNGVDLENFLDKTIESSGFNGEKVDTSVGVETKPWEFEGVDGKPPEFTNDPHIWTSPVNVEIQINNIVTALTAADADNAAKYKESGDAYLAKLKDLDTWAQESISSVPKESRVLFTSHDAFRYFSNRYDIEFIGSAIPDFSDLSDATHEHMQNMVTKIKDSGATAIFAENSNSDKDVQTLAKEAGVDLINAEEALYGDSLGEPGSPGETYIGSIIHNVTSVTTAWKGTLAEIPASLSDYHKK